MTLLCDLLVLTRDGEWGEGQPAPNLVASHVIRGTDFARARVGDISTIPTRYLPVHVVDRKRLQPGDVLIETAGGTRDQPTGRTLLIDERLLRRLDGPTLCASFARFMRPDPDKVSSGYLFWWLQFLYQTGRLDRHQVQHTGVARFQYTRFAETTVVPLRSLSEQQAIANVLGALDDKIESNHRISGSLEEMARAIFESWFVDFDPVRLRAEGRRPHGMATATSMLFPTAFDGHLPIGWRDRSLGELISVLETGSRPKGGVGDLTTGVPSIGAESIVRIGYFDFAKTKYVSEDFFGRMTKGVVENGDVLIYKDGGRPGQLVPHVSMFGDEFPFSRFSINEHVYRVRGAVGVPQSFLYFALSSERTLAEMAIKGTGVAVPGLNSTAVRSLQVLTPPSDVLAAFDALVAPMIARIFAASKEARILAELRDYLLPRLLSGEIRVRDAEKLVEQAP